MDWIEQYSWVVWLVLILLFITIEMLSLEFTFLMLAIGSTVGLVAGLLGVPWWAQFLIGAAASVLLLLLVKPPLLRALRRGEDPAKSNVDALLGSRGQVVQTVSGHGGQVKLSNGELWTAIVPTDSPISSLEPGTAVRVLAIEGATAVVVPNERKLQ
ncbi:NfeD family protein [Mycetocola miduiensis]|uniref:Membrane protein implicated in regulation of membrane protease activity n=1 Tax=Mycetocola miduiensis TaxID=995034 RepID=A0A1I5A6Z9_9MICO|nr:NfeD family protein [Mycetocola miduiensis]SFN58206.1 Membrane protein implicated in regulation of membrane protease activity [Mycetocola miduiensis]